jgi:DNA-binding FadR family transcriptional regulator
MATAQGIPGVNRVTKKPRRPGGARAARAGDKALRLHGSIARDIGVLIVSGHFKPGQVLDGEVEASEQRAVSRTAYREAVRILAAKGLVHSRPRVGTRVSPQEQWHLMDPDVLSWVFSGEPEPEVLLGLFELRGVVEPAAAAMAAARRSDAQLVTMKQALEAMTHYTLNDEAGRIADMEFHAALLSATSNPFMVSLIKGVTAAVDALTAFKLRIAPLKRDPAPDHWRVYEAIAARDSDGARNAMNELVRLALQDTPVTARAKAPGRARTPRD